MKRTIPFIIFFIILLNGFGQVNYSTKSKRAIKLYEEGQLLLRQRRFTEAIEKLNAAVEKDDNFIEAHLRLAFSYELLREIKKQQYHLEQIVRIAPNSNKYKNVYYSLGKVYFNQGNYDKSRALLNKLEELGIDTSILRSKHVDEFDGVDFDLVVTLCGHAKEVCGIFPWAKEQVHMGFDDPISVMGSDEKILQAFRDTRESIRKKLLPFIEERYESWVTNKKRET